MLISNHSMAFEVVWLSNLPASKVNPARVIILVPGWTMPPPVWFTTGQQQVAENGHGYQRPEELVLRGCDFPDIPDQCPTIIFSVVFSISKISYGYCPVPHTKVPKSYVRLGSGPDNLHTW